MAVKTWRLHLEYIESLLMSISGMVAPEDLTSQVGSGAVFVTAHPYYPTKLEVYLNGIWQNPGVGNDYTESDPAAGEFTFEPACVPSGLDTVRVKYLAVP